MLDRLIFVPDLPASERPSVFRIGCLLMIFAQCAGLGAMSVAYELGATMWPGAGVGLLVAGFAPAAVMRHYTGLSIGRMMGIAAGGVLLLISFPFLNTPILWLCIFALGLILMLRHLSAALVK